VILAAAMDQRKASARFYGFENTLWELPSSEGLRRRLSIPQLQLFAGFVWAKERGPNKCPVVRPLPKINPQTGKKNLTSYYWPDWKPGGGTIHLLPKHRNVGSVLHEIAHALGRRDKLTHGPAFRKRCLELYKAYGDWSGSVG
jgi:hypothetical protein